MTSIFSVPFEPIGNGLRALSLSGSIGNIVAICLYIIFCSSPIIYYFFIRKCKKHTAKDELLWIISLCLFGGLYLYINPGMINEISGLSQLTKASLPVVGCSIWSIIIFYVLLCILHGAEKKEASSLLSIIYNIILAIVVVTIFGLGVQVYSLATEITSVASANSDPFFEPLYDGITDEFMGYDFNFNTTYIWLITECLLGCIPSIMLLRILFIARNIVKKLQVDSFDETAIDKLRKLSQSCNHVVIAIGLLTVVQNFAQLLLVKYLPSTNYEVVFPIYTLLFVFIIMLLARKFSENRDLKLDNDSFI